MSLNLFTRSTVAITGALVSLGTLAINPASAARITYDFFVSFSDLSEPLTGRFSYDESTEVNTFYDFKPETVWGFRTYETQQYEVDFIEFSFLDKVYTQSEALSPISWSIHYADDYNVGQVLNWKTEDFDFYRIGARIKSWTFFRSQHPDFRGSQVSFSRVKEEPISVPEPTLLGGLSVLSLAGLLGKKRRKAQSVD